MIAQTNHLAIDPTCGMTVDERTAISAERDGETFYFCCESCRRKFLAGETKADQGHHQPPALVTLGRPPALDSRPSTLDSIYTCPMHPQIEQVGLGTCPICGMALEPKTVTAGPEDDSELRDMTRRFWVATAFAVPVFLLAMLPMVGVPVDQFVSPGVSRRKCALEKC